MIIENLNYDIETKEEIYNSNFIELNECRICLEKDIEQNLIYPCKCKFPIHTKCLKKWLNYF